MLYWTFLENIKYSWYHYSTLFQNYRRLDWNICPMAISLELVGMFFVLLMPALKTEATALSVQSLYRIVEYGQNITGKIKTEIRTNTQLECPRRFSNLRSSKKMMVRLFYDKGKVCCYTFLKSWLLLDHPPSCHSHTF